MFRRINWLAVLIATALVYFGAMAAPALSQHANNAAFNSASR